MLSKGECTSGEAEATIMRKEIRKKSIAGFVPEKVSIRRA
jgi:hypothetical protein